MTLSNPPAPGTTTAITTAIVPITVDGRPVAVPTGTSVLEAARLCGVRIPTLCHHPDLPDAGVCRLCVVEVDGAANLQAACALPVTAPIVVRTRSPRVARARRDVLDLLFSEHAADCPTCVRNGSCELQDLAAEHGIDSYPYGRPRPSGRARVLGSSLRFDPDKCVQCLRCVRTCETLQGVGALGVLGRGDGTTIGTYLDLPFDEVSCIACGQCINRCPTGALQAVEPDVDVLAALDDPARRVVIQTAPAPRAAIGEEFGQEPGTPMTWRLNSGLRELGFDAVFDTNFAADLTIVEEGAELLVRLHENLALGVHERPLPMFTSCCPGWVKDLEHRFPQFIPNLSTCRSPQQMFGSLIRTWYARENGIDPADLTSISLMPCTAKKLEAARPELGHDGRPDVDVVLTTRELAGLLRRRGIDLPQLPDSDFDDPFGTATGSGVIFGATGGVMEAALRTVVELVTGDPAEALFTHADVLPVRGFEGVRRVDVEITNAGPVPDLLANLFDDLTWLQGATLRCAVVHGTDNAHRALADIAAGGALAGCHFIEFMACPGGCIGGGGQPVPTTTDIRAARARAIYAEDAAYGESGRVRKSHENPAVQRLYRELLTDGPGGRLSHELLHTRYTPRGTWIGPAE
ncbi:[FeFe] hydrogenase, group A [Intrasporangium sp.]|uniref:[FeFe] hydrogenase, group A n=1 Tax=Intrasporangium sp. TaxID=1925024 RepID=UPI00293A0110|nr:[FeFe] hydrogenase, group A [Intrasporangium sp.]MDV3221116.1 [FeFe] hydrogenase, group A [Intrasporangium sp.]